MTNPDDIKDKFYAELHDIIAVVPRADKLIVLGDFNAKVGSNSTLWVGKHGVGN